MNRLHCLLENSARLYPRRIAVEDPERSEEITYEELDELTNKLRDTLVKNGIGPGDRVGIHAPKSIGTIISILGTLKAGASYVPADPGAPTQRTAYIFQNCSVEAIIGSTKLLEDLLTTIDESGQFLQQELEVLPGYSSVFRRVSQHGAAEKNSPMAERNLAYILYTSGSTGQPKGVMHTHASALSFIDWCSDVFQPTAADRFSSHAPFHFDLSILDIYLPLKHGATLVLIGEELGKQPLSLAPLIAERRLSIWYSTPSILRLLAEFGRMDRYDYSTLNIVCFAGEVFPVKHFLSLKSFWPAPRYFNLYGPTETNVCTYYEVPADIPRDRTDPFPIGKACSGDRTRVMTKNGEEANPGEEGELYVSGGSVMLGYWNQPERNQQVFYLDHSGNQWYKTGDIVREAPNGNYLFVGRRDRMVKRRGYRVELGEIETALYRLPSVTEVAVIALPDEEKGVSIKAFLSCANNQPSLSLIALKQFCAQNLPLYMVPDHFSIQPSLPKTSTDKVDYQKLREFK